MEKLKDILNRLKSPVVLLALATLIYTHFLSDVVDLKEYKEVVDIISFVVLGYGVFNNPTSKKGF